MKIRSNEKIRREEKGEREWSEEVGSHGSLPYFSSGPDSTKKRKKRRRRKVVEVNQVNGADSWSSDPIHQRKIASSFKDVIR
ncbi:hypothetical protein Nepgr_011753 [Nepenthes gracilis]|uniref:Uncharacterized protein n=1 Tax=Nepenthes gracilis TaxID=150966 RepID=A0AAD3XM83_NEPGR|nr:hypothetical protein Nepgr_011753 [Nepenthes gracilis]